MTPSSYTSGLLKRFFDISFATVAAVLLTPFWLGLLWFLLISHGKPLLYGQKRIGKQGRVFRMWKFRTMHLGAHKEQEQLRHLNEADGPVFKIKHDPRFTRVGKWLAWSGIDELPQLFNVLIGEMSLVGPRPLPITEARKLTVRDRVRELVRPGMTSSWVVSGGHKLPFKHWMHLDRTYVMRGSFFTDMTILLRTTQLFFVTLFRK
jgi:lipopolysaccharide/colanic/teichoic acid biosynthesis glycosyltransferase